MDNLSTIRLELGINAQKIISQSMLYSENLDDSISKGIELGLSELVESDDAFQRMIAEAFKQEIRNTITRVANDWHMRHRLQETISAVIDKRLTSVAESWAEKLFSSLDNMEDSQAEV